MSDTTKYTNQLRDRRVLVFGGSSGIGFSVAEACVEHGATVIISSANQKKIDGAIERIVKAYPSAAGGRVSGVTCDLGDATTLEQNVIKLLEHVGTVDHIVHSAGDALYNVSLQEITVDVAIKAAMVRYYAPLMISKHAPARMTAGPWSSITLTTGGIAERPLPNWILIGGIMSGVSGLMRGLALDLAPIRVNIVEPGAVETELWSHMSKDEFEGFKKQAEDGNPTKRLAQPEDIAHAYLYLMKDPNVTGTIIKSNSGHFLK